MVINKHHHNQQQNIIMSIINNHISINNTATNQQLHIISHNSSKGENTPHYDKHHIQHPSIIHTSSFNYIRQKISQGNRPLRIIFDKVRIKWQNDQH